MKLDIAKNLKVRKISKRPKKYSCLSFYCAMGKSDHYPYIFSHPIYTFFLSYAVPKI